MLAPPPPPPKFVKRFKTVTTVSQESETAVNRDVTVGRLDAASDGKIVRTRCHGGARLLPYVSELTAGHGVHDQEQPGAEERGGWPAGGSGSSWAFCWRGWSRCRCNGTASARRCSTAIPARWPRFPARSASWPITARCTRCRCWRWGRCWWSGRCSAAWCAAGPARSGCSRTCWGGFRCPSSACPASWDGRATRCSWAWCCCCPTSSATGPGSSFAGSARPGPWRHRSPIACSSRWPATASSG